MSNDKGVVEIVEPVVLETKEIVIDDLKELDSAEQKMAEEQGVIKKADEKADVKEVVKDATTKEGETQTFEATEKDETKLIKNYNSNEQALYWKWKHDKKERQEAQAERDLSFVREKALKGELEKIRNDHGLSAEKLARINKVLTGPADEITVEALQEIIASESKKVDDKDKPLTVKDLEALQEKQKKDSDEKAKEETYLVSRIKDAEDFGKTKFGEDYDNIMAQAQEVLDGKVDLPSIIDLKSLSTKLVEAIKSKDVELETVAEYVTGLAKLNPKFGKPKETSSVKKETNDNIDRILKNDAKQKTSASVGGGNGRRVVSYDDLTAEDASKMTTDQWRALPAVVRQRLLA